MRRHNQTAGVTPRSSAAATRSSASAARRRKGAVSVPQRPGKLTGKEFEQHLRKLEVELVKLQFWVQHKGLRVIVVFEGRDGAGKGGVIKRITERVSPRVFRVVALPAPTEREKTQLYMQRYLQHFPAAGEVVIFDRSWYNRAGVERVMGFCSEIEISRFLTLCPLMERFVVQSGLILIKYWFEVSQEEQTKRFESRMTDGRKLWKLSPMDLKSHHRWYDYSRARDEMLIATDTSFAPWYIVNADDKRRARLNCIAHLLSLIPYEDVTPKKVRLDKRQKPHGYVEPTNRTNSLVPERF
jgi:polyphosphate kinase 2